MLHRFHIALLSYPYSSSRLSRARPSHAYLSRLIKRVDVRSGSLNNVEMAFIRRTLQDATVGLIKREVLQARNNSAHDSPFTRKGFRSRVCVARGMLASQHQPIGKRRSVPIASYWCRETTTRRYAASHMQPRRVQRNAPPPENASLVSSRPTSPGLDYRSRIASIIDDQRGVTRAIFSSTKYKNRDR